MATEDQKKERLLKLFNIVMYSMIGGLWDLFGESSFAISNSVGDKILEAIEKGGGLEVMGEDPKNILMEIARLLTDEAGTMKSSKVTMTEDGKVSMVCEQCFLREATAWLAAEDVQPFACIPMNICAAAMRKRLNAKHRLLGRKWDEKSQSCTIEFQVIQ